MNVLQCFAGIQVQITLPADSRRPRESRPANTGEDVMNNDIFFFQENAGMFQISGHFFICAGFLEYKRKQKALY